MAVSKFNLKNNCSNDDVSGIVDDLLDNNFEGFFPDPNIELLNIILILSSNFNSLVEKVNILNNEFPSQSPDDSWTVTQIKAWLDQENIDYTGVSLKADLLELANV